MAVVMDYMVGPCRIIVNDDDYINKTPEEIQGHIDRASRVVLLEELRRQANGGSTDDPV